MSFSFARAYQESDVTPHSMDDLMPLAQNTSSEVKLEILALPAAGHLRT